MQTAGGARVWRRWRRCSSAPALLLLDSGYRVKQRSVLELPGRSTDALHGWFDGMRWRPTVAGEGGWSLVERKERRGQGPWVDLAGQRSGRWWQIAEG